MYKHPAFQQKNDDDEKSTRENVPKLSGHQKDEDPSKNKKDGASQNNYSRSTERDFNTFSALLRRLKDEVARHQFDNLQNETNVSTFVHIRQFIKGDHDYARQIMSLYQELMRSLDEDTGKSLLAAIYDREESQKAFLERPWEHIEEFLLGYFVSARDGNFEPLEKEFALNIVARQKFESFFEPKLYAKSSRILAAIEELYETHDLILCRMWQSTVFVVLRKLKEKDFNRNDFQSKEDSRKWMDRYYCTTTERSEENTSFCIYEETHDAISRFEKKEFLLEFERKSIFLTNEKGKIN